MTACSDFSLNIYYEVSFSLRVKGREISIAKVRKVGISKNVKGALTMVMVNSLASSFTIRDQLYAQSVCRFLSSKINGNIMTTSLTDLNKNNFVRKC
jgi:hypothetical protein